MIYNLKGKVFALAIQSMLVGFFSFFPISLFIYFQSFRVLLKPLRKILYVNLLIIYKSIIVTIVVFKYIKKRLCIYTKYLSVLALHV